MRSWGNVEVFTGLFFGLVWIGPPHATAPRRCRNWMIASSTRPKRTKNKSSKNRSNRMQRFVSSFFGFRWRSLTSVPAAFVAGSPLPRVLWELRHTWLLSFCSLAMTRFESARDVGSQWLIPKLFGYRKLLLRLDIHILFQASSTSNF